MAKKTSQDEEKIFDKASGRYWTKAKLEEYRNYQNEFIKATYQSFVFRCNRDTDADIIDFLRERQNLTGYIKELIRKDIAAKNGSGTIEGDKKGAQ